MSIREQRVGLSAWQGSGRVSYSDASQLSHLIAAAMREAGLGQKDPSVPLADIITPGDTVLVKPNWVAHINRSNLGTDCLVTHPEFILAALREVFNARPGRVVLGDAPIQSCDFDVLVTSEFQERVRKLATCPVEVLDFRRTIMRGDDFVSGQQQGVRAEEHYVLFDLGADSLLEPVSRPEGKFRITNYDPDLLAARHRPGKHQYLLCREPFEADVILNLPKLKTHKKAGLTAALKNVVGLNGNKEYLPHHRIGGSATGGDCYPGRSWLKAAAEYCLDKANRHIGRKEFVRWRKRVDLLLGVQRRLGDDGLEGGWFGNDTVWRMTLDLNRLLLYGHSDGTLDERPVRQIYSLTDGLIAGDRDGPLAPSPVEMGIVTFASSSAFADLVHAALMRHDPRKIPLVRESFGQFRYPLVGTAPSTVEVSHDGDLLLLDAVYEKIGRDFQPPAGWRGHVEWRRHE